MFILFDLWDGIELMASYRACDELWRKVQTPRERIHRVAISYPSCYPFTMRSLPLSGQLIGFTRQTPTAGQLVPSVVHCWFQLTWQLKWLISNFIWAPYLIWFSAIGQLSRIEFRPVCSQSISSPDQSFALTDYLRWGMSLESVICPSLTVWLIAILTKLRCLLLNIVCLNG